MSTDLVISRIRCCFSMSTMTMNMYLALLDTSGSANGHMGWSVLSDLTHFQLGDPYQTYMVGRWYSKDDAHLFLGSKVKRSKVTGSKTWFSVKIYLLLQFFS